MPECKMAQSDKVSPSGRLAAIVVENSSVKHDQHQRLSAVPQELKHIDEAAVLGDDEKKDLKTVKSDKLKHRDSASSHSKPRGQSPEKIALSDSTKHKMPLAQPIPPTADSKRPPSPDQDPNKDGLESDSTYSVLPLDPAAAAAEVTAAETQGAWEFQVIEATGRNHSEENNPGSTDAVKNGGIDSFSSGDEEMSCSRTTKKKGISWNSRAYQNKVNLQDLVGKDQGWILVPKASMVNAKAGVPIQVPSGITICLPVKKSTRNLSDSWRSSGISITVSKKQLPATSQTNGEGDKGIGEQIPRRAWHLEISDGTGGGNRVTSSGFRSFRDKCDRMWSRFKTTLVW